MTTMFNSLMNRTAKRGKAKKIYRRAASPSSPASFTTPEIIEISDHSSDVDARLFTPPHAPYMVTSRSTPNLPPAAMADPFGAQLTPYMVASRPAPSPSPRVHLALPFEPLGFPADILGPEAIALRRRRSGSGSVAGGSSARGGAFPVDGFSMGGHHRGAHGGSGLGGGSSVNAENQSGSESVEEFGSTESMVDVVTEDPSYVQFGSGSEEYQTEKPFVNTSRRHAPTPITIPEYDLRGRRPQMSRMHSGPRTRASSLGSSSEDGLSAISGTTMAAGVLAGTFRLSVNSARRSYPRASNGGLTRQDSATLPMGENPFLHSPYWRARRISGGEIVPTPPRSGAGSPVPPVPPLPMQLRSAEPRIERRVSDPTLGGDGMLARRLSAASPIASPLRERPPSMKRSSSHGAPAALALATVDAAATAPAEGDAKKRRRISRISEVGSPPRSAPSPPSTPGHAPHTGSSNDASISSAGMTSSAGMSTPPSRPEARRARTDPPSSTSFGSSGGDFDSILNEYQFVSPTGSPMSVNSSLSKRSRGQPSPSLSKTMLRNKASLPRRVPPNNAAASSGTQARSLPLPRSPGFQPPSPKPPVSPRANDYAAESSPSPSATSDVFDSLLVVPVQARKATARLSPRTLFTRARTGATPQPIRVVRDSRDNSYGVTLSDGPSSSEHTSSGHTHGMQTFPETPSAMSPIWSPGALSSSGLPAMVLLGAGSPGIPGVALGGPEGDLIVPARLARSASLAGPAAAAAIRAKLSSQALSRSTSVKGNNGGQKPAHGGSPGLSTLREQASPLPSPRLPAMPVTISLNDDAPKAAPGPRVVLLSEAESHSERSSPASSLRLKPLPITPAPSRPGTRSPSPMPLSNHSSRESSLARGKDPDLETASVPALDNGSSASTTSLPLAAPAPRPSPALARFAFPPHTPPVRSGHPRPVAPPSPPESLLFGDSAVPHASFVAPPAYHVAVSDLHALSASPESTDRAPSSQPAAIGAMLSTPPTSAEAITSRRPSVSDSDRAGTPEGTPSRDARRARMRPPGPLGPRRPSAGSAPALVNPTRNASAPAVPTLGRNRGASTSSTRVPGHIRQQPSEAMALPRFTTTPVRWRGYTLEVAKWTFTSDQLQAVVSRAIRQSAEASTLRLLPLDVLDDEVPDEAARLEAQSTDLKNHYKILVRKREALIASLARATDGAHSPDVAICHRMLDELSELSGNMDEVVEELHNVTDQIGQLRRLRDVHSYSALAMALRKLNASFLKQVAETQELRQQVRVLEVEREDAWRQAQDMAQDLDYYDSFMAEGRTGTPASGGSGAFGGAQEDENAIKVVNASARSSRVSASRKSSVRKAGFRRAASGRRSQRSSAASFATASSATRLTFYSEDAPPVPPLPRRNLAISTTHLQTRISPGMPSTETPSSEVEAMAMAEAQRELYEMLGIPRDELLAVSPGPDGRPRSAASELLRRSRRFSMSVSVGSPLSSRPGSNDLRSPAPHGTNIRRASLPVTPGQVVSFYDAMTDERQAMLTTLKLIT